MTTYRLAVAGRYQERHAIAEMLRDAQLDQLPIELTASSSRSVSRGRCARRFNEC